MDCRNIFHGNNINKWQCIDLQFKQLKYELMQHLSPRQLNREYLQHHLTELSKFIYL